MLIKAITITIIIIKVEYNNGYVKCSVKPQVLKL